MDEKTDRTTIKEAKDPSLEASADSSPILQKTSADANEKPGKKENEERELALILH
ncbi:hypothetical protein D3C72_2573080 [compost metagenome]